MVSALIPDPKYGWLNVVDLDQLDGYLSDGETLAMAVENASFDMLTEFGGPNLLRAVEAIRQNNNDEAVDYWSIRDGDTVVDHIERYTRQHTAEQDVLAAAKALGEAIGPDLPPALTTLLRAIRRWQEPTS